MIPKIICGSCNNELAPSDKFCSVCGSKVEWQDGLEKKPSKSDSNSHPVKTLQKEETCPLCGHKNLGGNGSCESCGGALSSGGTQKSSMPAGSKKPSGQSVKSTPLKQFQSWKVTAALGVLLVATLVITRFTGQKPGVANMPPDHAEMVKTIETFEKQIKENPNDATALLQLANIYYDQKLFPRAIMMYDRYLVITPSNSDARVDLGTSYFQLALTDSTHRQEYFASAKSEMEKALKYTPNHQLACFNLAMVNLHTGDMEKATEWFKKCASIDSTSETGKRAQELIKQQSINHPPSS